MYLIFLLYLIFYYFFGNEWNESYSNDDALSVWESVGANELSQNSNHSLQFTLDKTKESPYYYNSGIKVSTDMTATYTQIKDVLQQIAIKTKGYLIEDKDKLLFIAEGKPLVVKNKEAEFTENEINSILKSFKNIGLTVREIRDEENTPIEDKINEETIKEITILGEKVTLKSTPIVQDGILQLPVDEIATKLGFDIKKSQTAYILTKDDVKVEYEIGTKNVTINDTKKIMSTASQLKDNTFYAEMNLVLNAINAKLVYDPTNGTIEIK